MELHQTLASITQEPKEDPQSFLIRALTIRQKITFASKKAEREEGTVLAALKSVQSKIATIHAEMKTLRGEVIKEHESTNDARANKPKSSGGSK